MAITQYNGAIGSFKYDDALYSIVKDDEGDYLHYIGDSKKNISLPKGITDCTGVFMGTNIEEPVIIPDGVVSTNSMYSDCKHLVNGSVVPDTVRDQSFMYDGCDSLVSVPNFSKNAENLTATCANCGNLKHLPVIPGTAKDCDSIALNCKSIEGNIKIENGVEDISYGFAGCESLKEPVELPPSIIKSEGTFDNCNRIAEDDVEYDDYVDHSSFVNAYASTNHSEFENTPHKLTDKERQAMAVEMVDGFSMNDNTNEVSVNLLLGY